jgi:hypothetical protein
MTMMMDSASISETSVKYQTAWRNNPGESHLHIRSHDSLKSHYVL